MLNNTLFECFCERKYNYDQMKNDHYRKCEKFKERFTEIDKSISNCIKNYVELLDPLKVADYNNGLLLLKFILKRYVNLIGKLYRENNKNENDEQKRFNYPKKNISAELPIKDNLSVTQFDVIPNNIPFTNISNNKNNISNNLNISQIESNMNKDEKDIIKKYYEKINEYNNTKNKLDNLDLIEKNLSNLLLNDCFVFTVDDSGTIKFATKGDTNKCDTKFCKCKIDDKWLYAIFLE